MRRTCPVSKYQKNIVSMNTVDLFFSRGEWILTICEWRATTQQLFHYQTSFCRWARLVSLQLLMKGDWYVAINLLFRSRKWSTCVVLGVGPDWKFTVKVSEDWQLEGQRRHTPNNASDVDALDLEIWKVDFLPIGILDPLDFCYDLDSCCLSSVFPSVLDIKLFSRGYLRTYLCILKATAPSDSAAKTRYLTVPRIAATAQMNLGRASHQLFHSIDIIALFHMVWNGLIVSQFYECRLVQTIGCLKSWLSYLSTLTYKPSRSTIKWRLMAPWNWAEYSCFLWR